MRLSQRMTRFAVALALLALAAFPAPARAAQEAEPEKESAGTGEEKAGIRFRGWKDALKAAGAEKRVALFYFTAKWCGYCRKMESVTWVDPGVLELSSKFVWSRIDIDEEPLLASIFGVRGVPALAFLNSRGEFLELRSGYFPPGPMLRLLQENVGKAEVPGKLRKLDLEAGSAADRLREASTEKERQKAVTEIVVMLAAPESRGRDRLLKDLVDAGRTAWPGLVACLSDRRLAVRAAAHGILTASMATRLPYDPFADEAKRDEQARAWEKWLASQPPEPESGKAPSDSDR